MKPIEEMRAFFEARVDGYDEHMMTNIEGLPEAYVRVAALLPEGTARLLDLGCGTGLELDALFARFPTLAVTGIDLTQAMLDELARKHAGRQIALQCGSYFDIPFEEGAYDAALSFETLHHFTHEEKRGLYRRIHAALRPGGVYIEADYMVDTQAEEDALFAQRAQHLCEMGAQEGFWHFDTPCTVENQIHLLRAAGFRQVTLVWRHAGTAIILAEK